MKNTLAAIARDRRCQALIAMIRKGREQIFGTRRPAADPDQFIAEHTPTRENMFRGL